MKHERKSLNKILGRMSLWHIFVIGSLVVVGLMLAACNQLSTPQSTATAAPFQAQETETGHMDVTPEVTETLFVEDTPTAVVVEEGAISAERKEEIISNVNAFLNAEGRFSEEELRKS